MKATTPTLLLGTLALLMLSACTPEKQQTPVKVKDNSNRFRTITTTNDRVGSQTVVCHNCRAEFKLSQKIQKMSMKGDTVVNCPVCHHNYLEKAKE
ncbi:MAG: hypothetical protein DSZ07_05515 [Sulfurovum sp.]|nr:MAG: hypothetical protein DSZ07_05515 [Sulfurovum sp.]